MLPTINALFEYARTVSYNGNEMDINMLCNPSHLEAVCPVVCGKTRAKQELKDGGRVDKTFTLLFHGDASLAGQGVVYETV